MLCRKRPASNVAGQAHHVRVLVLIGHLLEERADAVVATVVAVEDQAAAQLDQQDRVLKDVRDVIFGELRLYRNGGSGSVSVQVYAAAA